MYIKIQTLSHYEGLPLPTYGTPDSAGIDLVAAIRENVILKPLSRELIKTGIIIELPKLYEAQIRPRSGLAIKNGITVLNSPGTIDSDYRGEICVILINLSNIPFMIERGMRIAQMIVSKYEKIELTQVNKVNIDQSNVRGSSGFGSTGT